MKDHQLVVNVEDFRAVKKAELILDGITVVAGENGCGKSTLSKLLYYLFKTANEYEYYLVQEVQKKLNYATYVIDELVQKYGLVKIEFSKDSQKNLVGIFTPINDRLQAILRFLSNKEEERPLDLGLVKRFYFILESNYSLSFSYNQTVTMTKLLNEIESIIKEISNDAYNVLQARPSSIFDVVFEEYIGEQSALKTISISEYDYPIFNSTISQIGRFQSIETFAYIDTPMTIGLDVFNKNFEHWHDLHFLLREYKGKISNGVLGTIQTEILNGNVVVENNISKRFIYKRNDGKEFDLMSCATGVKSFAILQLLYKNGHLNDKTLLIIDEPEVHLHPQWIVEYARLMVLLNKELGVKFFIASHNPDMVSAIKYIAEREQTDVNLNFYLAEKEADEFTYTYRHLGTEIDDIFGSFNIALERINQYGI